MQVCVDHRTELLRCLSSGGGGVTGSRVVDEYINTSEALDPTLDEAFDLLGVSHVSRNGDCLPASIFNKCLCAIEQFGSPCRQDQVGAGFGASMRSRARGLTRHP
jgi:hypothetical protein